MDTNSDSLLNNPRFLQLWVGQACSFVGDAVSMVALVILVVKLTGSAAAVGACCSPVCCQRWRARWSASTPIASTDGPC